MSTNFSPDRKDRFRTIRHTDGLNGFALRTESPHDCYGAGHAGTALSAALGMAAARDKRGTDENVVCIFGDAALTNGISFEALNNIGHTTKRFIGILNDNEWSIAKNVGAISAYLNKLITNPRYNKLAKDFENFVRRLPKGELALKLAHKAEGGFKGAIAGRRPAANRQPGRRTGAAATAARYFSRKWGCAISARLTDTICRCSSARWNLPRPATIPIVMHVLTKKAKASKPR